MRKNPLWWTDEHTSAWERAKAAFRRDWEQTKADLTGRGKGHDLNQDANDTLRQAAGKAAIPPGNFPNLPDETDMERHDRHAQRAQERAEKAEERSISSQDAQPDRARFLAKKAEEARHAASYAQRMLEVNASLRWEDVEEPFRFGYGAALSHHETWEDLREELRRTWGKTYGDRPFEAVDEHVRHGWDRARKDI